MPKIIMQKNWGNKLYFLCTYIPFLDLWTPPLSPNWTVKMLVKETLQSLTFKTCKPDFSILMSHPFFIGSAKNLFRMTNS